MKLSRREFLFGSAATAIAVALPLPAPAAASDGDALFVRFEHPSIRPMVYWGPARSWADRDVNFNLPHWRRQRPATRITRDRVAQLREKFET